MAAAHLLFPRRPAHGRPAFADVAEEALDPVVRFLAHMVGDRDLAEDLAADTFERALRAWPAYDPERGTPVVWLVGIARRIALDHFRSERRRRDRERRYAAAEPTAARPDAPGGLSPALRGALAGLSREDREVVALRVVLGLDSRETAAVTGSTPSAVSTRLHRALTRLRTEVPRDAVA
jgi:RNA polymerase sigma-70 factor, ECF subfamily